MDLEFHYYLTHLTLVAAGVPDAMALPISHSSQLIDNNVAVIHVNKGQEGEYKNYISQTKNIILPRRSLRRIYPVFHFIPGNPEKASVRKDAKKHDFVTVPDSELSNKIVEQALATHNPYRIGIALHGYTDTFSHQNYTGTFDEFNRVWKFPQVFLPSVGHVGSLHDPDGIKNVWHDHHLRHEVIINQQRFLDALENIYEKTKTDDPPYAWDILEATLKEILCFSSKEWRIKKYREVIKELTKKEFPLYNAREWFDEAINEKVRLFRDATYGIGLLQDKYFWKNTSNYHNTSWYKFQEAIKEHQKCVLYLFRECGLGLFDLKKF